MGFFDELKDKANDYKNQALKSVADEMKKNGFLDNPNPLDNQIQGKKNSSSLDDEDKLHSLIQELTRYDELANELKTLSDARKLYEKVEKLESSIDSAVDELQEKIQDRLENLENRIEDKIDDFEEEEDEEDEEEEEEDEEEEEEEKKNDGEDEEKKEETGKEDEKGSVSPPPSPNATGFNYYAVIEGKQVGPYNKIQFKRLVDNGLASASTMVWQQGMAQWAVAGSIAEMMDLFGEVTPPPVPKDLSGPPPIPHF